MDLGKAIKKLPEHEPRADLWERIDADLRADAVIDQALDDLPVLEPKADAWEQIAGKLEAEATSVQPLWARSLRWVAAAAVVLLMIGVWRVWQADSDEKVTIAYATETVEIEPESGPEPFAPAADQKAERFIREQCAQQTVVCQKPEVKELKYQLDELNTRKAGLAEQLALFGNDPVLVQAQIKIENERAEVTKELVRILTI
ncbi:hypothetical protein LX87_00559 [Larkinella arboricola]|uniref:Uncharacterized protein n=1 Tax=Larkinella arboricola TaxID=643671 RepID=A0A327X701_LARAB|nr:hypothetical protein [Larkinella arboricola]RAK02439.1 hypothetical protein LX87_00559 [Larkinella arboricola]